MNKQEGVILSGRVPQEIADRLNEEYGTVYKGSQMIVTEWFSLKDMVYGEVRSLVDESAIDALAKAIPKGFPRSVLAMPNVFLATVEASNKGLLPIAKKITGMLNTVQMFFLMDEMVSRQNKKKENRFY